MIKSKFLSILTLMLLISCGSSNISLNTSESKSVQVASPFTVGDFYGESIVMPYPNIENMEADDAITFTIDFIDLDGKRSHMNANPSNKCNSGLIVECSGYRESFSYGNFVLEDRLIVIEENFDKITFSNYDSISIMDLDGANVKEIDRTLDKSSKNRLIALAGNKIYYSLANNELYQYDIDKDTKLLITNDNDDIKNVRSIHFEDDILFIHAVSYNDGKKEYNLPLLTLVDDEISVKAENVDGYVTHANDNFYILDPHVTSNSSDASINYYDGNNFIYSNAYFATMGAVKYNDYLIINLLEEKNDGFVTKIKLYNILEDKLELLDEFESEREYFVNAISGNVILLSYSEQISETVRNYELFPAYITITDDKLSDVTTLRK